MQNKVNIPVQEILLRVIAAAGLLSVALLAPNALQIIDQFYGRKRRKYHFSSYTQSAAERLRQNGLISFEERNGKKYVRLTDAGRATLDKHRRQGTLLKRPTRWDGKWRVVIFDIREQRRNTRDYIRRELSHFGFIQLQQSVWVTPFPCRDLILLLKADYKIGKEVLYMLVEQIENDRWLKEKFDL